MAASTPTRTPLGGMTAASPPRALSSCVELEQALLGELVLLAEEHGARRLTPTTFVTAAAGVRRRLEQHAEQVAQENTLLQPFLANKEALLTLLLPFVLTLIAIKFGRMPGKGGRGRHGDE